MINGMTYFMANFLLILCFSQSFLAILTDFSTSLTFRRRNVKVSYRDAWIHLKTAEETSRLVNTVPANRSTNGPGFQAPNFRGKESIH